MKTRFNGDISIAGAILAGGRASRFEGKPKGLLRLPDGRTFIARLLAEMKSAGLETVVISANENELYTDLGVPVVPDITPSIGPLGGIEAVLNYYKHGPRAAFVNGIWSGRLTPPFESHYQGAAGAVLFLPCDLPSLTRHEIQRLLESYQQRPDVILAAETADGTRHPLCSVVPVALLERVSAAVHNEHLGMKRLWIELGAGAVRFDRPDRFFNINSQSDYDNQFKAMSTQKQIGKTTQPPE